LEFTNRWYTTHQLNWNSLIVGTQHIN